MLILDILLNGPKTLILQKLFILNFIGFSICLKKNRFEPFLRKSIQAFMFELHKEFAMDKIFYISFYNLCEINTIREQKSNKIGKLMAMLGTITKTTEVRPELLLASFKCPLCGTIIKEIESSQKKK